MNLVYLSPQFPQNYHAFPLALRKQGGVVLGLGDEPYDQLSEDLKRSLNEYYKVNDMHHYDELVRAMGHFTHSYGKLDGIFSHNEYWLEIEARLRTDFNIEGFQEKDLPCIKRKSVMKRFFLKAGLPVARGKVLHSLRSAKVFANEVGFPLVAKPDIGVGASGTYKVHNQGELANLFAAGLPADYIFEEFIEGSIHSFDGLAGVNCEPVFFTSHIFSQGIMETVNHDLDIFYYSVRDIPQDLESAGRKLLRVFDVKKNFFHFEFFRTSTNKLIPLEVNMRPPGGLTTDMFNFASNIDIYQCWADLILHEKSGFFFDRPYYCGYIGRKGNLDYAHDHSDVVARFRTRIVHSQPIEGVFRGAIGDFGYVVRSPDLNELFAIAAYIRQKV